MTERIKELIFRLEKEHSLSEAEYAELITGRDGEAAALLAKAHGCVERERKDLEDFLQERWKGNFPIGWGDTLREAEYTQWVYKHVLGL